MQRSGLFVLFLVVLSALFTAVLAEKRVIEFGPSKRFTLDAEEVTRLVQPGKVNNFFDVTDHPNLAPLPNMTSLRIPINPRHQQIVDPLLPLLKVAEVTQTINELSQFFTRYYTTQTGLQAAQFLHSKYSNYAQDRSDIEVTYFENTWLQPSIIVRILGTGPYADELVILGGHIDSINGGAAGRAPGADDDASGSSTVMEVFRVFVQSGLLVDRTVEFHGYAAEEVGLRGSQAIASRYQAEGKIVAGMMQLDMTGYVAPGQIPTVGLIQDFVNPELTTFVGKLIDTYSNIGWTASRCGYACSDHASWTRAGYKSSFPFEGPFSQSNPNIHSTRDTLDKLNMEHSIEFAKIGLGFVIEMALVD